MAILQKIMFILLSFHDMSIETDKTIAAWVGFCLPLFLMSTRIKIKGSRRIFKENVKKRKQEFQESVS